MLSIGYLKNKENMQRELRTRTVLSLNGDITQQTKERQAMY